MRAAAVALLLVAAPALAAAPPSSTVLFWSAPEPELDDDAIAEAVAIYTRDLRLTVERAPLPPGVEASPAEAGARTGGARLAFWYRVRRDAPDGGDVILFAVVGDRLRALRVPGLAAPGLPRAIALKARALLTGEAEREPDEPTALPPKPPAPAPVPAPVPVRAAAPVPAPGAAPGTAAAPPAPVEKRRRVRLTAAGLFTLPTDTGMWRMGATVEAAVALRFVELWAGADGTTQPERSVPQKGEAKLTDLPIRVGARVVLGEGRFALGLGPTAALHLLWVFPKDAGLNDQATVFRAAAGLGGQLAGRASFADRFAVEARVLVETLVPAYQFKLHGVDVFGTGSAFFSFALGLSIALP